MTMMTVRTMATVEVDDQRSTVTALAVGTGLITFGIIAVLGGNIVSLFLIPAAMVLLVIGQKVEKRGVDRTVLVQRRERTPKVLMTAAIIMGVSAIASLLFFQLGWLLISLLGAGSLWALSVRRSGGVWPWQKEKASAFSEYTAEDWALYRAGDSIFEQTGLYAKSAATGLPIYPEVLNMGMDEKGRAYFEFRVLSGQQTVEDVHRKAPNIASAWDVPRVVVTEPQPHVARCTAIFKETKVEGVVKWQSRNVPDDVVEYLSALPMGVFAEDGSPHVMDLRERNFVIGGIPGSGKSSFVNSLLAHLSLHPDIRICFADLKLGLEAAVWEPRADQIIDNDDADEDDKLMELEDFSDSDGDRRRSNVPATSGQRRLQNFLKAMQVDMNRRYRRLKALKLKNPWVPGAGFFGPDEPIKIFVLDEASFAFLSGPGEQGRVAADIEDKLKGLVQSGRAAGYIVLLATQHPISDNLPNPIRSLASDAIAFHVKDYHGTHAILGSNYVPDSAATDPAAITVREKGQAVFVADNDNGGVAPARIQFPLIDDATTTEVVKFSAKYKRRWFDDDDTQAFSTKDVQPASGSEKDADTRDVSAGESAPRSDDPVEAELEELLRGLDGD